jgi:hypothetical protein
MTFDFRNMTLKDRWFRVCLGILLLFLGWYGFGGRWAYAWRILAIYPLLSGLAGWCPFYTLFNRQPQVFNRQSQDQQDQPPETQSPTDISED